ncbi:MAG TPA: hypothetical protein VFY36_07470 [Solirubrobacteraceae bacterium]|nr:hypothetical protein [Solirubrobacteraceae bacterium]
MVGKPAEPARSDQPQRRGRGDTTEQDSEREIVGPLEIEKLSKEDGRALILYSSAPPPRT